MHPILILGGLFCISSFVFVFKRLTMWLERICDLIMQVLFFTGLVVYRPTILVFGAQGSGKTSLLLDLHTATCTHDFHDSVSESELTAESLKEDHESFVEVVWAGKHCFVEEYNSDRYTERQWLDHFGYVDAVVFVVDACFRSKQQLDDTFNALHRLLEEPKISRLPVLILGNKTDKTDAATENELVTALHLFNLPTGKARAAKESIGSKRPLELFMCSIKNHRGYGKGLRWLANYM